MLSWTLIYEAYICFDDHISYLESLHGDLYAVLGLVVAVAGGAGVPAMEVATSGKQINSPAQKNITQFFFLIMKNLIE